MMFICLHLLLLSVIDGLPLAKIPMNNLHHMFTSPEDDHNMLNQIVSSKDDHKVLLNIVANADPAKLHDIIELIRVLLVASENELAGLTSESGNADVAYTNAVNANNAAIIAQTNGITQLAADFDVAQAAAQTIYDQGVVSLQDVVDASNIAKDVASGAKNTANGVLSSERSRLESEISSLKQVIALIEGVIGINTVAPTVAPNQAAFIDGVKNSNTCPDGYGYITTESDCRLAAANCLSESIIDCSVWRYNTKVDQIDNPKGCYYDGYLHGNGGRNIYFNTHVTGGYDNPNDEKWWNRGDRPLCKLL